MTVFEEILIEEYNRCNRIISALYAEIDSLPKGYLQQKYISGKKYLYLQWREGAQIKSKYIKNEQSNKIKASIEKRKADERQLKELLKTKKQIEKAIGKDKLNELATKEIS